MTASVYQCDRANRAAVGALELERERHEAAALDSDLVHVSQILDDSVRSVPTVLALERHAG